MAHHWSRLPLFYFVLLTFAQFGATRALSHTRSSRGTLILTHSTNITRVTIDNPPINLFDDNLAADFRDFLISIQPNNGTTEFPKVVVIDSADPDFFVAHVDLSALVVPIGARSQKLFANTRDISALLRNTTTTVFISEVNGRTSGYGNEVILQTDLRFVGPNTRASQIENSFGVFPGGGGTQALPRLINRGRALQYIFTSEAVDGPTGTALGWFNEYFPHTSALKKNVNKVAERIALIPAGGINATKAALVELCPPQDVYDRDLQLFVQESSKSSTQDLIRKALILGKNQTRSRWELDLPDSLLQLYS